MDLRNSDETVLTVLNFTHVRWGKGGSLSAFPKAFFRGDAHTGEMRADMAWEPLGKPEIFSHFINFPGVCIPAISGSKVGSNDHSNTIFGCLLSSIKQRGGF